MSAHVRAATDGDRDFVEAFWIKSFRAAAESGPYPPDLYFPTSRETIRRLLVRPGVDVLVLDDPASALLGFIAHEPCWRRWSRRKQVLESYHVIHYVYVREPAREKGAAKLLLASASVRRDSPSTAYTFHTRAARYLLGSSSRWLPDAARYPSKEAP